MVTRTIDLRAQSLTQLAVPPGLIDLKTDPTADLANSKVGLYRRILAVSEGIHNGIEFSADEIVSMVDDTCKRKKVECKGDYYAVPIVLDHSNSFLDKVGATTIAEYSSDLTAAISEVLFWENTEKEREVAMKIRQDPDNTFFSVRVRGELSEPSIAGQKKGAWAKITGLRWMHTALVNEPADENARILSENETNVEKIDMTQFTPETQPVMSVTTPTTSTNVGDSTSSSYTAPTTTNLGLVDFTPTTSGTGTGYIQQIWTTDSAGQIPFVAPIVTISPQSDIGLNKGIANETHMVSEDTKQIADLEIALEKEKVAVVTLQTELATEKTATAELKAQVEKFQKDFADLEAKIPLVTEILAIDSSIKREFLYSLSLAQLTEMKTVVRPVVIEQATTQKSVDQTIVVPAAVAKTPLELSREAYGSISE